MSAKGRVAHIKEGQRIEVIVGEGIMIMEGVT